MAPAQANAAAALRGIVLAACAWSVESQTYRLDGVPAPGSRSLNAHHVFHVYGADADVPNPSAASVQFQMLSFSKSGSAEPPAYYQGFEVSLLRADSLSQLADTPFCTETFQLKSERAVAVVSVPRAGSSAQVPTEVWTFSIHKSGNYVLAVSNCGTFSKATISGKVKVKSAHGHLPATQLNTMYAFGWLAVMYAAVFVVWTANAARRAAAGLFHVHYDLAVVSGLCFTEEVLSRMEYAGRNATGDRSELLSTILSIPSVLKFVVLWRLVLQPSLGAGIVSDAVSGKATCAFTALSAIFGVQGCLWRAMFSCRSDLDLDARLLAMLALPGAVVAAVMYTWTFKALSSIIHSQKVQESRELLSIFRGMRVVFSAGVALSVMVVSMQFAVIGAEFPWERQWAVDEGLPQLSFAAVLVAMMYVWWPSEDGWMHGYTRQGTDEEVNPANKGTVVAPEPIGVADEG
eukprot:CAMPEP_0175274652 /NCGR_PEP_ID=MMETSP0093-20121207/47571_1 /TAXON_ID=311494 /ORGANISM="Alexandrium monilatum, Strain CCMP3105" /LENGTH=460 /DNA_ID=CAMNT_0016569519 /DNA_START=27 /DNA_END=1409 /DNA_ORIENTATION=+